MRNFLPLAVCGLLVLCGASSRASDYTTPVGYQIQSLPATEDTWTTTYLGVPLSAGNVFSGPVATVGSNTLSVEATSGWTDGQFTATPCYARITSGAQAGRTLAILANTSTNLTLDLTDGTAQSTALDTANFALAAGDTFEIVPNHLLGNLFGGIADQVGLWNLQLGAFETYSFDSQTGRWTKDGASPADDYTNLPIPPHAALSVMRGPGRAAAQFTLVGSPATVPPLIKLVGGGALQYVGALLPVDSLLINLELGSSWRRKGSYEKADVLSLYKSGTGKWKDYFQRKDGHWLRPNGKIKDSVLLPAGAAVGLIERKDVSGSASFLQIGLPYTP